MAENTFTYNFNELILAKQQLKSIIQDGGLEPGEVFAQYPGYIASIIEGGGTSSYLLVTKEELYACGYITAYDVSNMSYATQSYVADYVSTYGGSTVDLSSYVTYTYLESKEYITAEDIPGVDLTDYPTYTYLYTYVGDALNEYAPDLTYYPTFDDISNMGYITMGDVSTCGYITAADVPEVNLSYVLSTYNLRYINETPFGNGKQLYLLNSGLGVADSGAIYPESYSYSQIVSYLNNEFSNPWIGGRTMKNYVEGRIAELESSSVTPSYLAANYVSYGYASANYVSYGYAYNTFVSYAYLGDLEQISEYILGSGSSSAPENVYATKTELGAYVSKISLQNMAYITMDDVSACGYATTTDLSNHLPYLGTLQAHYTNSEHFIPKANNTYYLGNSNFKWQRIYTYNLYTNTAYLQDTSYTKTVVPDGTDTYTLGDASHLYASTYSAQLNVGNNSKVYNDSGGITFSINSNNGIRIGSSAIYPKTSEAFNNGSSSNKWANTYTTNIYTDNVSYTSGKSKILINDRNVDIYANNKKLINVSDYNGVVPIQTNVNLGGSSNKWGATYTTDLYADTIHNFIWTGTSAQYAALDNYTTYQIYMIKES